MSEITYVFKNGQTLAIREGKVIAASADSDDVERQVREASPYARGLGVDRPTGETCPGCGAPSTGTNFCPDCGEPLGAGAGPGGPGGQEMGNPFPHDEPSPGMEMGGEAGPYLANVVTPNGLKGTIMGKVATSWGEEVTIRLENGRIVHLPVGTELKTVKVAASKKLSALDRLEQRLAQTPDGTRESLTARLPVLASVATQAAGLIREGVSYADSLRLDQIRTTADVEAQGCREALAHLDDVDSYAPPGFSIQAAHSTAGVSREDASWLDAVYDDMIKTAESTDYAKLMDEGPEVFIAELPDVALADTGTTRQMATSFIAEKTAGVARDLADPYTEAFLARIEQCRRSELADRKQTIHKEAAAQEDKFKDLPDDALFL